MKKLLILILLISSFVVQAQNRTGNRIKAKKELTANDKFTWQGHTMQKDSLLYSEINGDSIRFHQIDGSWTKWYLWYSTLEEIDEGATNKHFTATYKAKVDGIASGAEVNVNPDWNASSGDAQIFNKPTLDELIEGTTNKHFTSTDKTNLNVLVASGSGLSSDFTLSEDIAAGKVVQLLANGQIEDITQVAITENIPSGSEYTFNSGTGSYYQHVSFLPNSSSTFVVVYTDTNNSSYGTAVVGTVSGSSITYGAEYVFNSGSTAASGCNTRLAFDPNNPNTFIVVYRDDGNADYGTAIVGIVSGTTISFGSEYVFNSASTGYFDIAFDSNTSGKFVIAYDDNGNSSYGTAVVGIISGATISFGSEYLFRNISTTHISVDYDPTMADKFIVGYSSGSANVKVGTITGTTISFGSETEFSTDATNTHLKFDPNNKDKFAVAFYDGSNSSAGTAVIGTVSETSVSFGSKYTFNTSTRYPYIGFDPNTLNKFTVVYKDFDNSSYVTAAVGTITGTTISFGSEFVIKEASHDVFGISFDPNNPGEFVSCYNNACIMGVMGSSVSNLDSTRILGILNEAGTTGQTKPVSLMGGVDNNQSGLTIGETYYIQTDGAITTNSGGKAVRLGRAFSTTSLQMQPIIF